MKLNIKLSRASYTMHIDGNSMTVEVTATGTGKKDGLEKDITSILGYYGPAQVDLAITRIIAEELTHDNEKVNLREFLIKYKAIHETIDEQVEELKNQISKTREK
jgi:hypothetical protein